MGKIVKSKIPAHLQKGLDEYKARMKKAAKEVTSAKDSVAPIEVPVEVAPVPRPERDLSPILKTVKLRPGVIIAKQVKRFTDEEIASFGEVHRPDLHDDFVVVLSGDSKVPTGAIIVPTPNMRLCGFLGIKGIVIVEKSEIGGFIPPSKK